MLHPRNQKRDLAIGIRREETVGYFFCVQDRSLLCRRCDVVIHTANALVSTHQRFLLTGVKVGLEATESGPSSPLGRTHSHSHLNEKNSGLDPHPVPKTAPQVSTTDQSSKNLPVQASVGADFSSPKLSFAGGSTTGSTIPQWQLDEFLELGDFNQSYDFMDHTSSKADCGKFGDSDCSPVLRAADMELGGDDCMGLGPDTFWAVPEIPSPPTASGLSWPRMTQTPSNSAVFVPDIVPFHHHSSHGDNPKRRRRF